MTSVRILYTIVLILILPLVLLGFLKRGIRNRRYLRGWSQYFGFYRVAGGQCIWVHAASMGELQAALPLIDRLIEKYPDYPFVISNTSPTGAAQVRNLFGDRVQNVFLPFDLPLLVNRFLHHFRPRIAVIMETEIWPNLFAACRQQGVNIVIANARLSDKSLGSYRRFHRLFLPALKSVKIIACQSQTDKQRFEILGVEQNKLSLPGNLKFDISLDEALVSEAERRRNQLGRERFIWVAASTRDGEERIILDAFAKLRQRLPSSLLVLVPRHPERFLEVANLVEKRGFQLQRLSEAENCKAQVEVFLVDAMGVLQGYYGAADVVFVGGSLVPIGGHNPLEPAIWGKAIITGPYVSNVLDLHNALQQRDGILGATDADSLAARLFELLDSPHRRDQLGKNAQNLVLENQGAAERLLREIEQWISL